MPLPPGHPLYTYYSQWASQTSTARTRTVSVNAYMVNLGPLIAWADPVNGPIQWDNFRNSLISYCQNAICSNFTPDQYPQLLFAYNSYDYWGGTLTMDDILSAMATAEFEQLRYFVGLTDAYKVAIWNQPFNAEFYAALARGFTP